MRSYQEQRKWAIIRQARIACRENFYPVCMKYLKLIEHGTDTDGLVDYVVVYDTYSGYNYYCYKDLTFYTHEHQSFWNVDRERSFFENG